MTRPSIIVPAYNEAACIERTLSVLTEGLETDSVEIVVVCNGCRDDTAARARDFRPPVRVMEREEASKVRALNAGERTVTGFPRVYLDADVELDGRSLQLLLDHASSPGALAAEPRPEFVTSSSTVWVRAYYSVWRDLHGRDAGRIGSGVVALSRAGRERFGEFPDVIADDGYVRRHFGPGELKYVDGARSRVHTPRRLPDLVRIKVRSRLGTRQLAERAHAENFAERPPGPGFLARLLRLRPTSWPLLPVYLGITLWVRLHERASSSSSGPSEWARDDSSRQA